MKIKYLRDAPQGNQGDVAEVADMQARVLILRGFAEEHKPRAAPKKKTEANKDE